MLSLQFTHLYVWKILHKFFILALFFFFFFFADAVTNTMHLEA